MDNFSGTITIMFGVFDFLFAIWWAIVFAPLTATSRRRKRNEFHAVLAAWVFMAVVRVMLAFNPKPMNGFLVPEPLNTLLFAVTGVGLFALYFLLKARQRRAFMYKTSEIRTSQDLLKLSPTEFEDMVVELYRMAGHQAERTGTVGDHGVDIVVRAKNGEKWIVQCKRHKGSVSESVVRDFYGTMQHEKADKGTIIAAGRFTQPALGWAKGKPITLYDGEQFLDRWVRAQKQQQKIHSTNGMKSLADS